MIRLTIHVLSKSSLPAYPIVGFCGSHGKKTLYRGGAWVCCSYRISGKGENSQLMGHEFVVMVF